jgi:hypothetical protein
MTKSNMKKRQWCFCRHGLPGDGSAGRGGGAAVLQGARPEEGCAARADGRRGAAKPRALHRHQPVAAFDRLPHAQGPHQLSDKRSAPGAAVNFPSPWLPKRTTRIGGSESKEQSARSVL